MLRPDLQTIKDRYFGVASGFDVKQLLSWIEDREAYVDEIEDENRTLKQRIARFPITGKLDAKGDGDE